MMSMPIEFEDLFVDLLHWHGLKDSRLSLRSRRLLIEAEETSSVLGFSHE